MLRKATLFLRDDLGIIIILLLAACQGSQSISTLEVDVHAPTSNPGAVIGVIRPTETVQQGALFQTEPSLPTVLPSETSAPTSTITPTSVPQTTLLFTGVIVPARCVQAAIDEYQDTDYLYDEVRGVIQDADLGIGTLNATISDFPPRTGCIPTYVLVGCSENADALDRAGFDLMSVATNHIKDCGIMKSWCDYTLIDTLENFRRVGIKTAGAGANLNEALKPVIVEINGIGIVGR